MVSDSKILDMTDEELDMFQKQEESDETAAAAKAPAPGSEDGEIVVSYGEKTPPVKSKLTEAHSPHDVEQMATQEYMTVSEMEKAEKKKKKKMGRKNSKSIQKQKHEEDSAKNVEEAGAILSSGSQMGFKSNFRINPLLRMSGAAPPTPPPTPATDFSSSAPSEGLGIHSVASCAQALQYICMLLGCPGKGSRSTHVACAVLPTTPRISLEILQMLCEKIKQHVYGLLEQQ